MFFNICHLCGCGSFNIYIAKIAQWLKCLMTVFLQQRALLIHSQWCHGTAAFQAEAFFKLKNVDLLSCFPSFQEHCLNHFGTSKVLNLERKV